MTLEKKKHILLKVFNKRYLNKIIFDRDHEFCKIIEIYPTLLKSYQKIIWIFYINKIKLEEATDPVFYTTFLLRLDVELYFSTEFIFLQK